MFREKTNLKTLGPIERTDKSTVNYSLQVLTGRISESLHVRKRTSKFGHAYTQVEACMHDIYGPLVGLDWLASLGSHDGYILLVL